MRDEDCHTFRSSISSDTKSTQGNKISAAFRCHIRDGKVDIHCKNTLHTHIPWIHKCVIKTPGCGSSNKYTHTNLKCKILQTFCKNIINHHTVRHPHCVFINYNWINQLSNTTIWWLDICCLLHRYQLHVSALMAIFRLID